MYGMMHNGVSCEIWWEDYVNNQLAECEAKWSLFYMKALTNSCPEELRKTMETLISVEEANLGSEPCISQT
jgi:hypothetical protein